VSAIMREKESIEKSKTLSVEEWKKLLTRVRLENLTKEDFNLSEEDLKSTIPYRFFTFLVSPSMEIIINKQGHSDTVYKNGLQFGETVTEGNIEVRADNCIVFTFKSVIYQKPPKFEELDNNYLNFKEAVRQKVLEFIKD
jgi:hypothetical protein